MIGFSVKSQTIPIGFKEREDGRIKFYTYVVRQ